jgi:malonyl-CoA O-methyltransferase
VHDDVPALLRSLKRIGAGNASPITPRGLAGKRIMLDMMQRYKNEYGLGSGIPATYEIIYGLGRKAIQAQHLLFQEELK